MKGVLIMGYLFIIGLTIALTLVSFTPISTSGLNRKTIDITIAPCNGDIEIKTVDAYTTLDQLIDFHDSNYDLSSLNPSMILSHGDYITLPCVVETTKISINTADLETLMQLPGIGQSTAQAIIDYRNANGLFQTIEQLMEVPGIKEGKFEPLKDQICL